MAKGAPLAFGDLQLVSICFATVAASRFELPSKPLTAPEYQPIIGTTSIVPASGPVAQPTRTR